MDTKHYLRLLRTFALATLTAAAVAACSDDTDNDREPLTPPDGNDGIPVTFTANINPGSDAAPAAAPGTRTVLTPTANGGFTVKWKGRNDSPDDYDKISIWADNKQGTLIGGMGKVYVPTTSNVSSELEPWKESEKFTLPSAGNWTFTAVYTVAVVQNSAVCTLSPQSQSEPGDPKHIARYDFSVATATKHVETGDMPANINFTFKHMLSALQLHITNETGAELTVKEIRLSADGGEITTQKTYDVAQGNWKTTGELKAAYLQLTASSFPALATGGASQDLYMLFFPEPEHSGTNMTITVITDRGEFTLTKKAPASPGFLAGKNYMTNIAIKTSGLTDKETWRETIRTPEQLAAFCERVNGGTDNYQGKTIYLADNIDLANASWTPIGTEAKPFSGTFDGGGYSISGLNVNISENYAGLFGYVDGGTVRNLRVKGTVKATGRYAGGIAGYLSESSTVENCIFDGTVSGSSYVGGIAGQSATSRIAGCHTKGKVTATATSSQSAGGIAGQNIGSAIDGCYSEAEVTVGNGNAGGIAGMNQSGGTITHCYATGKVSGKSYVGGIVGYQFNSTLTGGIALNPGLTRTEGDKTTFGRITGSGTGKSCGAYDGMTFTDGTTSQPFTGATGFAGTDLTREQCVTEAAYTSRNFPVATATTPGWAFDYRTTWTYLPWNSAFESFHNISETDYCISVPDHLKGTGTVN